MNLREAAEHTSRSITTLRRYIRSGRLRAEKRYGRFGAEYYVTEQALNDAGLHAAPDAARGFLAPRAAAPSDLRHGGMSNSLLREIVPLSLYQELRMKHEQLLVQYGMVRAGGLRVMELQAKLEQSRRELGEAGETISRLRRRIARETGGLREELRRAHLELQARNLEIEALLEKVRALEMLTRNAATTEAIDRQFARVREQADRVRQLGSVAPRAEAAEPPGEPRPPSDH